MLSVIIVGLLQKISWTTRKWNLKFNLLEVYLHDGDACWGFSLCEVIKDHRPYSLLAIEFRLPNGAEQTKVRFTNWDILYLSTPVYDWTCNMHENMIWGYVPSRFEIFCLKITDKMFKI
jgi:hypothetical protein